MINLNYEIISQFYDNSSIVKFEFKKRKYCHLFCVDSSNEIDSVDGFEIEARKLFNGQRVFFVMKNEHSVIVGVSENGCKDIHQYHVLAILESDKRNNFLALIVIDVQAKTFEIDMNKIMFVSSQGLTFSEALKLKSVDVIYSSFF